MYNQQNATRRVRSESVAKARRPRCNIWHASSRRCLAPYERTKPNGDDNLESEITVRFYGGSADALGWRVGKKEVVRSWSWSHG